MIQLVKKSAWVIVFCGGLSPVCLAVGPVNPNTSPPVQCVEDGVCNINGCQATPDPDCSALPDSSSTNEPDMGGAAGGTPSTLPSTPVPFTYSDLDLVRLTDDHVDFGDNIFILGAPLGFASLQWSVDNGFYTPRLTGTLHIDNASGKYVRMHMSYWDGAGGFLYTDHSNRLHATDNKHHSMSVNLAPSTPMQIVEAHVCTEISDNGSSYDQVDCKTFYFN